MVVVDATSGGSGGNFCSGTGTQLVVVVTQLVVVIFVVGLGRN